MANAPVELQVITLTYDLVIWSCKHLAKFPRSYRFTLGQRLEYRLYDVLERLIRAKFTADRQALLCEVNLELELLRFQFRMAKDLRCLNVDSYGYATRIVNEIGQMVGGWLKHARSKRGPEA